MDVAGKLVLVVQSASSAGLPEAIDTSRPCMRAAIHSTATVGARVHEKLAKPNASAGLESSHVSRNCLCRLLDEPNRSIAHERAYRFDSRLLLDFDRKS